MPSPNRGALAIQLEHLAAIMGCIADAEAGRGIWTLADARARLGEYCRIYGCEEDGADRA